jgi:N-acetyl-gamma-glutamyl-phosphate reductase
VGSHRHTPEIARNLSQAAGKPVNIIFTPHLAPMNRGILSTIYIPLADSWKAPPAHPGEVRPPRPEAGEKLAKIYEAYAAYYQDEPFVRVLPLGALASSGRVRMSNYCDISMHIDQTGSTLIVITAIDNMVKGAAGQAVQNMNIILGYDEKEGLEYIPSLF